MGVVRTISTKLAVEGESQYKQAISSCNSELSTLKSTLALAESQFKGNANSMEALTAKGSALSSLYDKQRDKVETLEKALANAKSAQETYAERVAAAKEKVAEYEKALRDLENSTGDTSEEQAALTAELDKWNAELQEAQGYQVAAERGVNNWQKQLNNANIELNNLNSGIEENKKHLKEAGESADGCATSIDQYGKKTKEAGGAVSDLGAAIAAAGIAKLLKEIADAFKACVDASIEFESAITGVYKTVDGTAAELAAISDGIKEMAVHIPATTTEIAAVAEAAGQLGIKTADVLSFTDVMINLGVATNLTAEEAASMLAKFANITGLDQSMYRNLGSAVVALGNNFATTERDIVTMSTRLASAGELAGLTEHEILALATAMSSVGIEAEAGGTAMSQTLTEIEKAVVKGGEQLEEFARVAGMSSDEFSRKWKAKPVEAIQAFTAGLGGLAAKGESATLVLDDMGLSGIRQSNMLRSLALSADNLSNAVSLSSDAWAKNTALTEEAGKRYATTESRIQMMENASNNLQIAIGDALSPALGTLADVGTAAFQWAADFVEDHPGVVSAITGVATAIGILAAAFAGFTIIQKIIPLLKAFNTALIGNPYLAVAAAIVGITVAIGTLVVAQSKAATASAELTQKFQESKKEYEENIASIEVQNKSTENLTTALIKALSVEEKSAAQKRVILNLVEDLNEAIPDLGLAYDDVSDSINMTTEALVEMARIEGMRRKNAEDFERLTTITLEHEEAVNLLKAAEEELAAAETARAEAQEKYRSGLTGSSEFNEAVAARAKAREEVERLTQAEADLSDEMAEVTGRIGTYIEKQKAHDEATAAAREQVAAMEERVGSLVTEMTNLSTAYDEAYQAAYDSISQQLGIFNELDGTAKTSIDNLIATLDGQIKYMDTYAANIKKAMELGVDEGLVKKLSEGSEESAQILAAIVQGGGDKITALNEKFAKVEEGKGNFASLVSQMETDFDKKMGELVTDLDKAIADMNVADDAYCIGADNIQGLVDGAASKKRDLVSTYIEMARAAIAAYKKEMEQRSPSKKMFDAGSFDFEGLIRGAKSKEAELKATYENMAHVALDAERRAMPRTFNEPSVAARQDRQTAEIVKALSSGKEKAGDTFVNITSPEPMDERTAAREFKKAQRDLSLQFS